MIDIAIVEDDEKEGLHLKGLIERHAQERGDSVSVQIFDKPLAFLNAYKSRYDAIFLDIELPGINGMELAQGIRREDETVILVFITHLEQFAIAGYGVSALDYVVKPARYERIASIMGKIKVKLDSRQAKTIVLKQTDGIIKLHVSQITYIEVSRHNLTYHTADGHSYANWGSLNELEETLPQGQFARCNSCYLVNLHYVTAVKDEYVHMRDGETLKISRKKKQAFIDALVAYAGESGNV